MVQNALGIIMAGGAGSRLWPLTESRAKPAVPIAGKFRLIDIPISNCINSRVRKIFVLTQFNSTSLNEHISRTYFFAPFSEDYVQILAAQQTAENKDWYQGTADSVRQNLRYFMGKNIDYHLILAGDHLYSMDYQKLFDFHIEKRADVTIGVLPVKRSQTAGFGVLKMNQNCAITDFVEKPQTDEALKDFSVPAQWIKDRGFNTETVEDDAFIGSMGIYVFNRNVLDELLNECNHADFGKGIIPYAIQNRKVFGYLFNGYWEDVGTIGSFYNAMMDLVAPVPRFNFYEAKRPIYTRPRYLAGAKIGGCHVCQSIVNDGAILEECQVVNSMVGIRSLVKTNALVHHSVLMGADYYESAEDLKENKEKGIPDVGIGPNSVIERAIIDKNARIGAGVKILNRNRDKEIREENYVIRDGIVIVPKNGIIPPGAEIG